MEFVWKKEVETVEVFIGDADTMYDLICAEFYATDEEVEDKLPVGAKITITRVS